MDTLLVSLGTAAAIVPEAYLLPATAFRAVHVITTDSTNVALVLEWFSEFAPEVELTVTRVADFIDFRSVGDHLHFEEVLYRWILEFRASQSVLAASVPLAERVASPAQVARFPPTSGTLAASRPFVCLSGGFKTMSAAMQKAAALLGAAEVFHALCNLPVDQQPKSAAQIAAAHAAGHLRWIRLGAESGWPQFYQDQASDYPLITVRSEGNVRWVAVPDMRFRERLWEIVERAHRIAGAWDALASLPFQILATLSSADLDWLREPLDPRADREWVAALPKIELHCHLGERDRDGIF